MAEPTNRVTMVDADGNAYAVNPAHVERAAAERGWTIETTQAKAERDFAKSKGGSVVEGAKSVAEHLASGLTLGGSDVALTEGMPGYREQRQLRDATMPGTAMVGEGLSYVVPGLGEAKVLGVAGKIARNAPLGIASKVAAKAGGAVERAIAGQAPGVGRKILSKTVGGSTSGTIEGMAIGAGQAISEAAIQDKDLTAELLYSHARDAGLVGGVLGGGVAGSFEALSALSRSTRGAAKFIPGVSEALSMTEPGAAKTIAQRSALQSVGFLGSDMKRLTREMGVEAPARLGQRIIDEMEFAGPGAIGRAVKHDLSQAAEFSSKKVSEYGKQVGEVHRALEAAGDRIEVGSVMRRVDDDILAPLRSSNYGGDVEIARALERDLAPLRKRIERAEGVRAAQGSMGDLRKQVEELIDLRRIDPRRAELGGSVLAGTADAIKAHMREIGLGGVAGEIDNIVSGATRFKGAAQFAKLGKAFDRAERTVGEHAARYGTPSMSYEELWKLQQRVGKDVKSWAQNGDPRLTAYQQLYGTLKTQIAEQAERTGLGEQFKEANRLYSDWKAIHKVSTERESFASGNRKFSLTDTIASTGGASLGSVLGGGLGAAVGSLTAGAGNRFIRSAAGDRMAATLANRYAEHAGVLRAADNAATALQKSAQGSIKATPVRQKIAGLGTKLGMEYERQREAVLEKSAEQERLLTSVTSQLSTLQANDPEMAAATVKAGMRGVQYLESILPQPVGFDDLQSRIAKLPSVPESQTADWLRVAKVVQKPTESLVAAKKGTLTPEQATAIQEAYPSLHAAIRRSVAAGVLDQADKGRLPSYANRLQLSSLTGLELDASLKPEVIAIYQQAHQSNPQPAPGVPRPSSRKSRFASRRESITDREV